MTWQETVKVWQSFAELESGLKESLVSMNDDELKDAFYAPLEFGTAGMRGVVGAGINRMNSYTVRQATEGLARFMESFGEEAKKRGVAIAYDSRHFSPEFAMEAARTLAKHDIPSYVFESLRPTPELSFAVRHLHTFTGIMITASHNPSAYNGYKVYGEDGGQMPPQDADALTSFVREIENPLTIEVMSDEELTASGLLTMIGEDVDRPYLDELNTVLINPQLLKESTDLNVVYTPLHGTGKMLSERALEEAGFTGLKIVAEQAIPDGDFTTVKSPNPEEAGAFEYAVKLGKETDADLLLATDPDADRLGAAVRLPNGEYQVITGNQIAAILLDYILQARKETGQLPSNAAAVKSIVSSEFATAIAKSYDVKMIDVLTGFKFIAEQIKHFEETNEQTFVFGFEESYGFLIKPFVRDKDAIQTVLLLTEVAVAVKKQGKTLYDRLQELYQEHVYFVEKTNAMTFAGLEGSEKIKSLMKQLRQNTPQTLGGMTVVKTLDFQSQVATNVDGRTEEILLPPANVLKFLLEDGSWVAARPSGTEPKIKFYMGIVASNKQSADEKLASIEADVMTFAK